MYLFKYIKKANNSLIGYHLSTFCQVGEKERAKHYECTSENVDKQLAVIQKNFANVINATEENQKGKFFNMLPIKEEYFKDLSQDDVEIQYEEVPDVNIVYTASKVTLDENNKVVITPLI